MTKRNPIAQTIIIFELPFGINLPDGTYEVLTNEGPVTVNLKILEKDRKDVGPPGVVIAPGMSMKGDRWGKLFTSSVNIILNHRNPIPTEKSMDLDLKIIPKISEITVNRIIDVCRLATNEKYSKISWADILSYSTKNCDFSRMSSNMFRIYIINDNYRYRK